MWIQRLSGYSDPRSIQDHRAPYERDRTRAIHCPAFRRLQGKTQILNHAISDFHRTRLTHSLEVASIGCSIVRNLRISQQNSLINELLPDDDLINVICLLHDIGHPPFGHSGEIALNYIMDTHGGFESNGQTLRVLTKIEDSYGIHGLDLTRRSLLGILKYPVKRNYVVARSRQNITHSDMQKINFKDWLPPKAYFDCEQPEVSWLLDTFTPNDRILFQSLARQPSQYDHGSTAYTTFDCSIMNISDDIAYGVHDLEDALYLKLITREQIDTPILQQCLLNTGLSKTHPDLLMKLFASETQPRKQAIGEIVNYLVTATHLSMINDAFICHHLKYNISLLPEATELLNYFKTCVYTYLIDSKEARIFERGRQTILVDLFQAILNNTKLLDTTSYQLYNLATNQSQTYRIICDYIANMTDNHALNIHANLFNLPSYRIS